MIKWIYGTMIYDPGIFVTREYPGLSIFELRLGKQSIMADGKSSRDCSEAGTSVSEPDGNDDCIFRFLLSVLKYDVMRVSPSAYFGRLCTSRQCLGRF